MALRVVDRAMQVHGAEGISQDKPLAYYYAQLRTLRYADVSPACFTCRFILFQTHGRGVRIACLLRGRE